jgi:hypothetical protein
VANIGSMKLLNSRAVSVVGRSRGLTEYLGLAEPVAVDGNNSVLSRRNPGYLVRQLAASKIAVSPGTSGIDTLIAFPATWTRDSPWQTASVGLGTQWYPGQSWPLESGLKGAMRPYRA